MGFQNSIDALVKAFIGFFIACAVVGRPDIPLKAITELRVKALKGATASWGCPSVFNRNACTSYDPKRYKNIGPYSF